MISMERVLSIVGTTLLALVGIAMVAAIYAGFFCSYPTGRFYMDDRMGAIAVMEDIRHGDDKTVYVGEPGTAFRIMQTLNLQQRQLQKPAADAVVVPNGT